MSDSYDDKFKSSGLFIGNTDYILSLYELYLSDKNSVSSYWQDYFAAQPAEHEESDLGSSDVIARFRAYAQEGVVKTLTSEKKDSTSTELFIDAYRRFGHRCAQINPLQQNNQDISCLDYKKYGFSSSSDKISTHDFADVTTVQQLKDRLESVYCKSVAVEFCHVTTVDERAWLYQQVEKKGAYVVDDKAKKIDILQDLTNSEGVEQYFALKYVGQKRFSLEGGESLIPCLRSALEYASGEYGVNEVVLGMAHRGRLNVMLNVLAMPAEEIFKEFEGRADYGNTSGDVKYHLGYSSDLPFSENNVHASLMFNPSHLEFIGPVVNGSARARQDILADKDKSNVMPVIIHGDAAMAGQGVVLETLNMSCTDANKVLGSLHIIINNQIGFTATQQDYMSSEYCSGVAKAINAPIIHVNGDDPEAVVRVIQLAISYRIKFAKDIVIDLVCYRRLGHNEADEPAATSPVLYKSIKSHSGVRALYADKLVVSGIVSEAMTVKLQQDLKDKMHKGLSIVAVAKSAMTMQRKNLWKKYYDQVWCQQVNTGISAKLLQRLAHKICVYPTDMQLQRQVATLMLQRLQMANGEIALNWGMAELLAYATLLDEGFAVRLVGQDARRGTFSHRHSVLYDQVTGKACNYINNMNLSGKFSVYDSVLSEAAPLGFEYGYSITNSNCLTIWEAQFGDFANGGQVIIDQFISSGYQKWRRFSGLVLLLPHGYEGMGPEHSSARLERFMQLAAQNNIQVCVPSTPAQMFHLLRRQMLRTYRKPLIIMTPKSLLRHPQAVSNLSDLSKGSFELVLREDTSIKKSQITRVVLCSGKVYYDLAKMRDEQDLTHVIILRLEQLYPFPKDSLKVSLSLQAKVTTVVWCQEEPKNQGAWFTIRSSLERCLQNKQKLIYAGRSFSAAPAVGYPSLHLKQQQLLVRQALGLADSNNEDE